jgi:IS1 family transposase
MKGKKRGKSGNDHYSLLTLRNQAWIWIALCRKTRQVVAYAIGDRSKETCRKSWESVPEAYRVRHCYSDFWSAYQAVIPEDQHSAVDKETGATAQVDRVRCREAGIPDEVGFARHR